MNLEGNFRDFDQKIENSRYISGIGFDLPNKAMDYKFMPGFKAGNYLIDVNNNKLAKEFMNYLKNFYLVKNKKKNKKYI